MSTLFQKLLDVADVYEAGDRVLEVSQPQDKPDAVRKRIQRNGEAIAILAGALYEKGKTGPGGDVARFIEIIYKRA